jgi:dihydrofolate synthase/folylpolyglutamate synthase
MLSDFKMLGRFDLRKIEGKLVLFDMAHTKKSVENLMNSLKNSFEDHKFIFLVSLMEGKDAESILKLILEKAEKIVYTNSHEIRGMKAQNLANIVKGEVIEDCNLAYNSLFQVLKKDQVLVVTGSHFLVSKILLKLF